jgi:RIO-like serine/threonine protein kinase
MCAVRALVQQTVKRLLKQDIFGRVELVEADDVRMIRRVAIGGTLPGTSMAARRLAAREQRILSKLRDLSGVPKPLGVEGRDFFYRTYIEGSPLYDAGTSVPVSYWDDLMALAERCHAAGVTHNDLAKEANILVTPDGRPAFIDFQVATYFPHDSRLLRRLAAMLRREDRRHLLKHKALYRSDLLSSGERQALANKSLPVRIWSATAMKPYQRVIIWLGWEEASGPRSR